MLEEEEDMFVYLRFSIVQDKVRHRDLKEYTFSCGKREHNASLIF